MGHRFECFLQHDSMQCGIACLAMICKHYGKEFSIETLSRYCFASTEGVSLLGISEAANILLEQGVSVDTPCCYLVITIIPAPQQPFLPLSYGSQTESSGLLPSAACGFLPFRRGCVPTRSVRRKPCGRSSAWRCAKSCHR